MRIVRVLFHTQIWFGLYCSHVAPFDFQNWSCVPTTFASETAVPPLVVPCADVPCADVPCADVPCADVPCADVPCPDVTACVVSFVSRSSIVHAAINTNTNQQRAIIGGAYNTVDPMRCNDSSGCDLTTT